MVTDRLTALATHQHKGRSGMAEADSTGTSAAGELRPTRLRDALRQAQIEAADRTGVVVDLRDAEVARLEILNEALDHLFAQIPEQVDLFDRGLSQGETPRLWIDVVAHVVMGRDKRIYRFVQDTRFGRIVIAESHEVAAIVDAVTDYVARRMIEREHALVATPMVEPEVAAPRRRGGFWSFMLGFLVGAIALFGLALYASLRNL
jgi:hypothetical protein